MPPEEFEAAASWVVRWIARYLREVGEHPVLPDVRPGDVRAQLRSTPPPAGEPMEEILDDFSRIVVPGLTHWNHPAFFGYFAVTGSGPGILGEALAAALNVNAMVWRSSPAATELEEHAVDWLRSMLGLPGTFHGVINDTASSSTLFALAAARDRALPEAVDSGLSATPVARVYLSDQAHSSVEKAVRTLGLGRRGARLVRSDEEFRMEPNALERAILEDVERGVRPVAVVATLGTTSTTSIDPLPEIGRVARDHGLWFHVDAAYGGSAALVDELRHHFVGWEAADSVVVNPHKWLFTPIDCSILYCRHPEALRASFGVTPVYLEGGGGVDGRRGSREDLEGSSGDGGNAGARDGGVGGTVEKGGAEDERRGEEDAGTGAAVEARGTNLMDYGVPLGRRFRALKLWFVLRYFGREGLAERIRFHCRMARELASWIDREPGWERLAPVPFSTVVFRCVPVVEDEALQDRLNREILARVNATGKLFLTHTELDGRFVLRFSIGNLRTTEQHVAEGWRILRDVAGRARGELDTQR